MFFGKITIPIKYFYPDSPKIKQAKIGNWIDLYSAKDYIYKAGERFLVDLGIAMQLPKNYEALVAPRSSTFKNYGVIEINSPGIVDTTYCGDNDKWFMACYSLQDGRIKKGERVCQMRIIKSQPQIVFNEIVALKNKDRGGYGSTGK